MFVSVAVLYLRLLIFVSINFSDRIMYAKFDAYKKFGRNFLEITCVYFFYCCRKISQSEMSSPVANE